MIELDRALAQAILLESMQRIAMLADAPQKVREHDAILEIFEAIMDGIWREATKMRASRPN